MTCANLAKIDEEYAMANVFDVAEYILRKHGEMTTMKLQKLVYYSQAWSLVWDEQPLFPEAIEAWANGPVVRALYEDHRGAFRVARIGRGNPDCLTKTQQNTIDNVLKFYGDRTSQWLSDLTHQEAPWKDARADVPPGEPCNAVISHAAMAEYYGSL
ncbi:MAG TPA: type II toxin-antitoxin system antitoxin SocA domain-containing protein [Bryobacteraceae bacterium]|nr:type II toxin-antitoxin system antitoxin SocA domain-containing protein [Bryobacteraceae bacterium]